ncbi:MAG TPA: tripartite tricarboxylate transporter substrate binding protein [Burkholderiaceae bacterium]
MLPLRSGRRRAAALLVALACGAAASAWAQDAPFPTKTVRIITSTAAGGSLDGLARIVAEKLQGAWGQAVVVEARPGANTMLATTSVARSAPDGYTVLFTIGPFVQNLVLQPNPGYKLSDFTPVSMVSSHPIALAASTSLPVDDIAGMVRIAKQRPGALSFGSFGTGSSGHVIGEGLNKLAGIQIVHVPYKGEAAALPDLISGQIQLAYGSVGFFARQVPTGRSSCWRSRRRSG